MNFPKENIIDNWLEKNSNPEISNQVEEEIIMTNLKYSFYNNWKLYIGLTILGLMLIGWFGSCPRNEVPATTETNQKNIDSSKVKIDEYEKVISQNEADILALQNQLHKVSVDFSNYKKTPLYKERIAEIKATVPIDTLAANTIELENCKEKSKIKDDLIKSYIEKSKFLTLQKFEFKKIDYNQNKIIDILKPKTKETFLKMNAGANIGINKELNQLVYGVNVSFEGKKGNQTIVNYLKIGSQDYVLVGKNFKIFDWKRESKN